MPNNNVVSSFGINMPAEYEQATNDVINELKINVTAPVLFNYCYNLLSNYGKNCVTIEDVFTFLIQCKNLGLNPLLKQIYGFMSRGKLVNVVSIEGWNAIAQRSPVFDGFEFEFGPFSERELIYKKRALLMGINPKPTSRSSAPLLHGLNASFSARIAPIRLL